jgi:hypothetical protein
MVGIPPSIGKPLPPLWGRAIENGRVGCISPSPDTGEGGVGEASEGFLQYGGGFPLPNPPPSRGRGDSIVWPGGA